MTAAGTLSGVTSGGRTGPSLGHVLVEIGQHVVDVLCAPPGGLAAPVGRARIWDAGDGADTDLVAGDLVLAVGVVPASPQLSRLLAAAGAAGVAAVAIRGPVNLAWVRTEAERIGVTVLVVPRDLTWDGLHTRIRTVVAASSASSPAQPPTAAADLYAVANTAAAALGGPVEIDDAGMRLLAFSNLPGGLDDLRTVSILTRLPPPAFLDWLRETGVLPRLRHAVAPVRIDPPGNRARLVVPVRAGIDVLGYVWLAEGSEPLGARHEQVLAEVARVVSAHLVRATAGPGRPPHQELVARALDGHGDTAALAGHLRVPPDTAFALVGFRPRSPWADPDVGPRYVRDQLELRRELLAGPGAAVVRDGHVYAAVPVDGQADPEGPDLGSMAAEVVATIRNQLGADLVAVIESGPVPLAGLAEARDHLDRALRLIADDPHRSVATALELRSHVTLALVRELAQGRPDMLDGPVRALAEIDRTRRTDYLNTLRAYFDTASDLSEAARVLFVHRNTLRYRLRRIQELCGLDLSDPVERLVAELQLRLLDEQPGVPAASALVERASG